MCSIFTCLPEYTWFRIRVRWHVSAGFLFEKSNMYSASTGIFKACYCSECRFASNISLEKSHWKRFLGYPYDSQRLTQIIQVKLVWKWRNQISISKIPFIFRPLCTLSFRLNYLFSGYDPFSYRLVNVMCHMAVTGLVVVLAEKLRVSSK